MEKKQKIVKRLIVDVESELHKKIKLAASNRNLTIKKYVLEALSWRLRGEKIEWK